ncbi:MAG: hypothetical protein B6I18_02860 [Bacteroidetes bacterium 4572_112]|nr:MAG: hypothetical protein B6I18_02860 [Bacteroidetes bacterium 4572_112]
MTKAISLLTILLCFIGASIYAQSDKSLISEQSPFADKSISFLELANAEKNATLRQNYIDSAEYYYKKDPQDTILLKIYYAKYKNDVKLKNYSTAISDSKAGINLSKSINKKDYEATFNKSLGQVYYYQKLNDSAYIYLDKALNIYLELIESSKDTIASYYEKAGYCIYKKGRILYRQNKFDLAIKELYHCIQYYNVSENKTWIIQVKTIIGNIYYANGDNESAYKEYTNILRLWNDAFPNKKPYSTYLNLGSIYLSRQDYDSALVYYMKAYNINKTKVESGIKGAGLLMNIGIAYKRKEMYDSSFIYFNKAKKIYSDNNFESGVVRTQANIGLGYIEMKEFNKAEKELKEVLPKSIALHQDLTTQEVYMGLYVINNHKKKYQKALEYYQASINLKDSIHSIEITNKINQYKEQFETAKKDKDIANLQQLAALQKLEKEKQLKLNKKQKLISVLLTILAVALVSILLVLRRFYQLKRTADLDKHKKQEEKNQQKVLDLVKRQEVNSINSYMEGQDKERGRIASELHDRLGSLLSTVKLHFSSFEADMEGNKESKESFSFALDLLDNSVQEVRTISHNLSKGVLTQFGLRGAIENLRDAINTAGKIQVKYISTGSNVGLPPEIEIEIFRIIQELITNAIKHSKSDEIFIQQINDNDSMSITIEDQGIGFDITKLKGKGIGLDNLRMRAENIGAIYHYETAPGQGTSVSIEIKSDN